MKHLRQSYVIVLLVVLVASLSSGAAWAQPADAAMATQPTDGVTINKTAPASVAPGGQVTYTLRLVNEGEETLNGVTVWDKLPDYTTFVNADEGGNVDQDGYVVWRNQPEIPPGYQLTLHFTVQAPNQGGVMLLNNDYGASFNEVWQVTGDVAVETEVTGGGGGGGMEVDTNFRPNPNGFGFKNWGGGAYDESTDLSPAMLIRLFGANNVCQAGSTANDCVLNAAAREWRDKEIEGMRNGHCAGFTNASIRYFQGFDQPQDLGGSSVFSLPDSDPVRDHISGWATVQGLAPADGSPDGWIVTYGDKTPNEVLNIIRQHMQQKPNEPLYLGFRQEGVGGHAVLPYAISDQGNGIYWLYIYDNNFPDAERYLIFDTNQNTWLYNFAALNPGEQQGAWQGNAQTKTLRLREGGALNQSRWGCPFCQGGGLTASGEQAAPRVEFQMIGLGKVLIVDQQGRKIGWDFQQHREVNQISGSDVEEIDGGTGVEVPPIYNLPLANSTVPYTVYVSGDTLDDPVDADLMMTGPGFAVGLEYLQINPGHDLLMTMRPDGRQITFNASEEGTFGPDIFLALDPDPNGDSYIFEIGGFVLSSFKTVTATLDLQHGLLYFEDDDGGADTYALAVTRIRPNGEVEYYANDGVTLGGNSDAAMNFGAWNGDGAMTFNIDGHNVNYGNEGGATHRVFLPQMRWRKH